MSDFCFSCSAINQLTGAYYACPDQGVSYIFGDGMVIFAGYNSKTLIFIIKLQINQSKLGFTEFKLHTTFSLCCDANYHSTVGFQIGIDAPMPSDKPFSEGPSKSQKPSSSTLAKQSPAEVVKKHKKVC